jgi:hypothetical protein
LFTGKKITCSIVLANQNNEMPHKNAFPKFDSYSSVVKKKQMKATKRKNKLNID